MNWAVPGASGVGSDIGAGVEATGSIGWNAGWLNFDVTASVEAMSPGTPNYGWKLVPVSGTVALKSYAARENATAANRPKLVIQYTGN
jgi:hypothetical protein